MKNKQEFCVKETFEIGVWEINLETDTIFWNTKTKEIFDVSASFNPDFRNTSSFINRKNLIVFKTLIQEAKENRIPVSGKLQITTAKK